MSKIVALPPAAARSLSRIVTELRNLPGNSKALLAEAKMRGFDPQVVGRLASLQPADTGARTLLDLYLESMFANRSPLFSSAGLLEVDPTIRGKVLAVCSLLLPRSGDVTIHVGGSALHIWRAEDGRAYAEPAKPELPERKTG